MLMRLAPLTALLAAVLATDSTVAQAAATAPTFQVIAQAYTPDEAPLVQRITDRLRQKFTSDDAFVKSVETAVKQRDFGTAAKYVASAAQVPADQIVLALEKQGAARGNTRMIHFAAARYSAPFAAERHNPAYIMIHTPFVIVCWSVPRSECVDALRKLGYIVP